MKNNFSKSILLGFTGSFFLLAFYFVTVGLISGLTFALDQFADFWYLIIGLALTFGIQLGLLHYIRTFKKTSSGLTVVGGSASGVAMIACCAHFLAVIIPLTGINSLIMLAAQYQLKLFWAGIFLNLAGISYLMYKLLGVNINKRSKNE